MSTVLSVVALLAQLLCFDCGISHRHDPVQVAAFAQCEAEAAGCSQQQRVESLPGPIESSQGRR